MTEADRAARPPRRLAAALMVSFCALCMSIPTRAHAQTFVNNATIVNDGITRYFDYWVPDPEPVAPAPLVLLLHGGTQNNTVFALGAQREIVVQANALGAVVVLPNGTSAEDGTTGPTGDFNWNDCRADAGEAATVADDVGFISALIDWAAATYPIDTDRVYAFGSSNGGMMSYRLAFDLSDRIAAVAANIANLPANSECVAAPESPIAVLTMNGTDDPFMPWEGGQVSTDRGLVLSTVDTAAYWRGFLGTDPVPVHSEFPDLDPDDGGIVDVDVYEGGADSTEYRLLTVNGGGHTVPSIAHEMAAALELIFGKQNHDIETAEQVLDFFNQHTLGSVATGGCSWLPLGSCKRPIAAGKAKLDIRDREGGDADLVSWKWTKGAETTVAELGDPVVDTDYAVCIYDEAGTGPSVAMRFRAPAGRVCSNRPCWKATGSKGFAYKDSTGGSDGVQRIKVKAGAEGKAVVQLKAKGSFLSARPFGLPALPVSEPFRVQLQAGDSCWEAVYDAADVSINTVERLRARGE